MRGDGEMGGIGKKWKRKIVGKTWIIRRCGNKENVYSLINGIIVIMIKKNSKRRRG